MSWRERVGASAGRAAEIKNWKKKMKEEPVSPQNICDFARGERLPVRLLCRRGCGVGGGQVLQRLVSTVPSCAGSGPAAPTPAAPAAPTPAPGCGFSPSNLHLEGCPPQGTPAWPSGLRPTGLLPGSLSTSDTNQHSLPSRPLSFWLIRLISPEHGLQMY